MNTGPSLTFRTLLLAVVIVCCIAATMSAATAQSVTGVVRNAADRTPLANAIVTLLVDTNVRVVSAYADSNGRFFLQAPGPGQYFIRVRQIGWTPFLSPAIAVKGASLTEIGEVLMNAAPITLPTVAVVGGTTCQLGVGDVDGVLEPALNVLEAVAATADEGRSRIEYEIFTSVVDNMDSVLIRESKSSITRGESPFTATSPNVLEREGYVRGSGANRRFHAPDVGVLLHQSFLRTHCFSLRHDASDSSRVVRIGFEPTSDRRLPDIAGDIVLSRDSLHLLRIEFSYVGGGLDDRAAASTGSVEFGRISSGRWIVMAWQIRIPTALAETIRQDGRPTGTRNVGAGAKVQGGRVLSASAGDGETR